MTIISERAKITSACCGMCGFDAEVVVEEITQDKTERYYVHANEYCGRHYTVAETSMFDYMTGLSEEDPGTIDFMEEYESVEEAREEESEFIRFIEVANRLLNDICNL